MGSGQKKSQVFIKMKCSTSWKRNNRIHQPPKTVVYVYDSGDDWQHKIELEKIIDDYEFGYPTILEGDGACPPEDVGGIPGCEEFLRAWNNPEDTENEEMRQWGENQHYRSFDIAFRNNLLKTCLKIKNVK